MKIQVRSLLFALLVPVAACGGDRDTKTVDFQLSDYVSLPAIDTRTVVTVPESIVSKDVKLVDVAKPMPTKLDELMAEGKKLAAAGKYGDAKVMLDAAIKLDKKNAEPHIELARMYISMSEKGLAVASANKAVKLAPTSSVAWNTKGRAEFTAHKYEDAIAAFTKSVELNPDNVFAWNNLGYTELQLKRYADAVTHLKEATSRPGATGYMFNNLGTALEQLAELDDARVAYEEGGKLGSSQASSSRKRLEGVDTVAVREYDVVDESDVAVDETEAETEGDTEVAVDGEVEPGTEMDEHIAEPSDSATL